MESNHALASQSLDTISQRFRAFLILVLLSPVLILGVFGMQSQEDIFLLLVSIGTYIVLCIPFLVKRTYYLVEPYTLVFPVLYLGIPIKIVWAMTFRDSPRFLEFMQNDPIDVLLVPAIWTGLSLLTLVMGYLCGIRVKLLTRFLPRWDVAWNRNTVFLICGIAVFVSAAVFALYARQVGISFSGGGPISAKRIQEGEGPMGRGSSLAYYRWAISLAQVAFYVVFAWALKRNLRLRGTLSVMLILAVPIAISFLMPFVTSSRTPLIYFLLEGLILLYCLKTDVFTGRWLTAQLTCAFMVVVLFMTILVLRKGASAEAPEVSDYTPMAFVDHVVGARYLADITKTAQIFKTFPEKIPYQNGISYSAVLAAPIPRNSWPGKPAVGLGPFVGENVYGLTRTGVPPGMIGEAYLNFGILGMGIVPFIFGFLVRTSFESLRDRLRTRSAALFYAVCFRFYIGALGTDVSAATVQFLMELIPVTILIWILQRHRRPATFNSSY